MANKPAVTLEISAFTMLFVVVLFAASCQSLVQRYDLIGGPKVRVTLAVRTDKLPSWEMWDEAKAEATARVLEKRLKCLGVRGRVRIDGERRFIVEFPDTKNKAETIQQLKSTASVEFRHFYNVHFADATTYRPAAAKYVMMMSAEGGKDVFTFTDAKGNVVDEAKVIAESRVILMGSDLKPVSKMVRYPGERGPAVAVKFTPEGTKKLVDFTRRNVGEILAITLGDRILSAPKINEPILRGEAIITGRSTPGEAARLADFINAGALPAPLEVVRIE